MRRLRDFLPSYRAALKAHPEATDELTSGTYDRYANAVFPQSIRWLLRNPALLRALAEDAERGQIPAELIANKLEEIPIAAD